MSARPPFLPLPPNRVWRTYTGGRTLDALAGRPDAGDGHWPEDWIASTTLARNPDPTDPREGHSRVAVDGGERLLGDLLAGDPDYYLGAAHVAKFGAQPQLLVKFLDPAIRLHCQVHPTTAFARARLGAPSGKTEAYAILSVRPDEADPVVYLGFQTPPSRDQLRRWIETQDIPALLGAMNRVSVAPGDTVLVPGGVPHALGAGLLLVELQEPSDLVVRFEFERGGYVLPESARFMGRGLEFCLDVFDPTPWPRSRIDREARLPPSLLRRYDARSWQEELIGPAHTPCFRLRRSHLHGTVTKCEEAAYVAIVAAGACTVSAEGRTQHCGPREKLFIPAGAPPLTFQPEPACTLLECLPPA